jgi:hypothetical protein
MKTSFPALVVLAHVALALKESTYLRSLKQARVAATKTERLVAAPPAFVAQTFAQPLDHPAKNSPTWQQRLRVGIRHYKLTHAGRSGDHLHSG